MSRDPSGSYWADIQAIDAALTPEERTTLRYACVAVLAAGGELTAGNIRQLLARAGL